MRVLVIEDEFMIAKAIRDALERLGHEVTLTTNAAEGLRLHTSWHPEMILLDLALPDGDGRDVCREIRSASDVPIIIISAQGEETDRIVGLELGADDYLVKPFGLGELNARIRAVTRRTREPLGSQPKSLAFRDLVMDTSEHRVWRGDTEISLTPREFQLLHMLLRAQGRLVTRADLAHAIWGRATSEARNALDVNISSLRRKLGEGSEDPTYIETLRAVGFRLVDRDAEDASQSD